MRNLSFPVMVLVIVTTALLGGTRVAAQIPATEAFSGSPACSSNDLTQQIPPDLARIRPEWKPIVLDPSFPLPNNPPTILEGFIAMPPSGENTASQANSEVAEEDIPWSHFTHDFTFKVVPDAPYQGLLSSYVITTADPSQCGNDVWDGGTTCHHKEMEVEWENGADMKVNDDDDLKWGALPQYAWPALGDRVWVEGRWIFDCGHPGSEQVASVKFETEIHPPRALVTFRLNHPALTDSNSASTRPGSWLPVTGKPVDGFGIADGPTSVPVTEADVFISGNGGGANDICNIVPNPCSDWGGHSGPWIPVNDRNYVFDIYPPGTDYTTLDPTGTGKTFKVTPPVANAALQWRTVDKSSYIPQHTCGSDPSACVALPTDNVLYCLLDANTPPPDQSETKCPDTVPANPTRVRVILKFAGTSANYFAESVLVGWDDVPSPPTTLAVRTFQISLHKFIVEKNGETFPHNGDWRVFVNVGGQWRYISGMTPDPDTDDCNHSGTFSDNSLTGNEDEDCYSYDSQPWIVSVRQGTDLYAAVGGFESDEIDSDFCPSSPDPFYGCDFDSETYLTLSRANDDRIGTFSFKIPAPADLTDYSAGYAANQMVALTSGSLISPPRFTTTNTGDLCTLTFPLTCDELQYTVEFRIAEVMPVSPPASDAVTVGDPHYNDFVSSATPLTLASSDPNAEGFQYRFHRQGDALPTYSSPLPFPVHWANVDFPANSTSVPVYLTGGADGTYDFQYSANSFANLLEPRHTTTVILDNTPPMTTFVQPAANAQYGHSDTLTLNYSEDDGSGSGVNAATVTPKMDSQTALQFCNSLTCLNSGQPIYLESMQLGTHTFSVGAADNLGNTGTGSVTFTITVTFASLGNDVTNLAALGCIDNISQSLSAKIAAAQNAYNRGQIQTAINILQATIYEVQAQAGKHISTTCRDPNGLSFNPVAFLLGDLQYLQASLASQLKPNPIMGWVVSSANGPVYGATVNLMSGSKTVVATTTTDAFGFFYFADTSGLVAGSSYSVNVVIPKGYKSSNPAAQSFTWSGNLVAGNFVLN